MEILPHSPETSAPCKPIGKEEMAYVRQISSSLQNPPLPSAVRVYLEKAQADRLDPQRIYETAVQMRPAHWMKAPDYSEVAPRQC